MGIGDVSMSSSEAKKIFDEQSSVVFLANLVVFGQSFVHREFYQLRKWLLAVLRLRCVKQRPNPPNMTNRTQKSHD